jgi:hypothetical protein
MVTIRDTPLQLGVICSQGAVLTDHLLILMPHSDATSRRPA